MLCIAANQHKHEQLQSECHAVQNTLSRYLVAQGCKALSEKKAFILSGCVERSLLLIIERSSYFYISQLLSFMIKCKMSPSETPAHLAHPQHQ